MLLHVYLRTIHVVLLVLSMLLLLLSRCILLHLLLHVHIGSLLLRQVLLDLFDFAGLNAGASTVISRDGTLTAGLRSTHWTHMPTVA